MNFEWFYNSYNRRY